MKRLFFVLVILLSAAFHVLSQASESDTRIVKIRDTYRNINQQIAEHEKAPEYSSIFVTELVVNKHNASYPAVGIYNSTIRFYYTYGDHERNPYPDRLLKITVSNRRAAQIEFYEYVFGETGGLVFAFEKTDDGENRAYYNAAKLIRFQHGEDVKPLNDKNALKTSKFLTLESKRLSTVFTRSL